MGSVVELWTSWTFVVYYSRTVECWNGREKGIYTSSGQLAIIIATATEVCSNIITVSNHPHQQSINTARKLIFSMQRYFDPTRKDRKEEEKMPPLPV